MIGEEFIKIFSLLQSFTGSFWINPNHKNEIHNFISKYMTVNSSNKKRIHMNETENKLIGEKILIKDKLIIECYNSQFHEARSYISVSKKVKIRGLFYGCTNKNTKHRDDCFITRDGKFAGLIKYIIEKNNAIYFISFKLEHDEPLFNESQPF